MSSQLGVYPDLSAAAATLTASTLAACALAAAEALPLGGVVLTAASGERGDCSSSSSSSSLLILLLQLPQLSLAFLLLLLLQILLHLAQTVDCRFVTCFFPSAVVDWFFATRRRRLGYYHQQRDPVTPFSSPLLHHVSSQLANLVLRLASRNDPIIAALSSSVNALLPIQHRLQHLELRSVL